MSGKKKVSLVYLSLIHYRRTVFENLWNNANVDFHIICSSRSPYAALENFSPDNRYRDGFSYIKLATVRLFKHLLIFQTGGISALIKKQPAHIIFLGFDPHIVSSIWMFLFAKYILRKKVYWWGHGSAGHQGGMGKIVRRFFYNRSDGILVYTAQGKKDLMDMNVKSPIVVAGNALNHEDYGFENDIIKKQYDVLRIIYSGRLIKEKHVDMLVEALQGLRDECAFECTIIGDGPEKKNLAALIDKYQLKNIKIEGAVYGEELKEHYLHSHLCVIPGYSGLALIHAMSFGVPVITHDDIKTHAPEIEILKAGVNGDYFRKNDVADLRRKIKKWNDEILEKKEIVCNNCIESVKNIGYTPENVAKNILSILK